MLLPLRSLAHAVIEKSSNYQPNRGTPVFCLLEDVNESA
jgi:hypothetical protein